jgi:hypothetical protein
MTQPRFWISISHYQPYSKPPLDQILLDSSTNNFQEIEDKLMPSTHKLVCNIVQNLGDQVELLLVFLVSQEVVPIDQVKLPSVTCVERVECLPHSKYGEDGIEELISNKKDMPLPLLLLLVD